MLGTRPRILLKRSETAEVVGGNQFNSNTLLLLTWSILCAKSSPKTSIFASTLTFCF